MVGLGGGGGQGWWGLGVVEVRSGEDLVDGWGSRM